MSYVIAIDIGGTFTDLAACDVETGVVAYTKCSGIDVMKFVCAPDIKPVMPELYNGLCPALVSHPPK